MTSEPPPTGAYRWALRMVAAALVVIAAALAVQTVDSVGWPPRIGQRADATATASDWHDLKVACVASGRDWRPYDWTRWPAIVRKVQWRKLEPVGPGECHPLP